MADRAIRIYLTAEQQAMMAEADPDTNWARVFRRACAEECKRQGVIPKAPEAAASPAET